MNEVRNSALTPQLEVRPASSKGSEKLPEHAATEELAPAGEEKEVNTEIEPSKLNSTESLQAALASINDYVQLVQRDLHFSVDEDLDKTVIKVIDGESGELIRQIPEDIFLNLARKLKEDGELHLLNTLG